MSNTVEKLDEAERLGFKLFGDTFKDTLAYIQIQRKKQELLSKQGGKERNDVI